MYDFRNYKELVKETVDTVNEKANWKWTARVNKNEIKLWNGYIKGEYSGDCNDYFSIKLFDFTDEGEGALALVEGKDCMDDTFAELFPGQTRWDDGSIENCISAAIKSANVFFESRY